MFVWFLSLFYPSQKIVCLYLRLWRTQAGFCDCRASLTVQVCSIVFVLATVCISLSKLARCLSKPRVQPPFGLPLWSDITWKLEKLANEEDRKYRLLFFSICNDSRIILVFFKGFFSVISRDLLAFAISYSRTEEKDDVNPLETYIADLLIFSTIQNKAAGFSSARLILKLRVSNLWWFINRHTRTRGTRWKSDALFYHLQNISSLYPHLKCTE